MTKTRVIDYEKLTLKELLEAREKSDNEYKKRIAARYEANKGLLYERENDDN